MGKKNEFTKAVKWIEAGNRIVIVRREYLKKIENLLQIRLKPLSNNKYLVILERDK